LSANILKILGVFAENQKNYFSNTFFAYALYCFIVCLFSAFFIFIFCLDKTEKSKIIKIIQNIICRIF
ncbi:polysaccharide biosynthesis protein, partial [Phocaeicola dorei]